MASPVSCKWVKPQGPPKGFDFDVTKAEQIFDLLLKEKQLKVPEGHKIPTVQELNGKPYRKWHNTFSHATNDCRVWRQQIQMAIEQGRLIFNQHAMKVDTHPFPPLTWWSILTVEGASFSRAISTWKENRPYDVLIVDKKSSYAVLLGRDWIHANCCIPSTMHQCLIQWDGDEVEVVHADDSAEISTAGMNVWETSGQEPLSGINLDDCERIDVTKNGVRLVLSTGLTV
ncbi:hypothetical protein QYE76_047299 [Lolium multiflorum]|uniref:Uncharacterized protein n=1 Tax=Lolium multiflorum TaxID=4521 RepID=A0AAD8TQ18_LOLMU|nr:hypothetical protein QYE76_047299 [Lolium multiflorum]